MLRPRTRSSPPEVLQKASGGSIQHSDSSKDFDQISSIDLH